MEIIQVWLTDIFRKLGKWIILKLNLNVFCLQTSKYLFNNVEKFHNQFSRVESDDKDVAITDFTFGPLKQNCADNKFKETENSMVNNHNSI